MSGDEQRPIGDEVQSWVDEARAVIEARSHVVAAADHASAVVRQSIVGTGRGGVRWYVLPLRPDIIDLVRAMAVRSTIPPIPTHVRRELDFLVTDVAQATEDLRKVSGFGRLLLFGGTRDKANRAARFLPEYRERVLGSGLRDHIESLRPTENSPRILNLLPADSLAPWTGLASVLPQGGRGATVVSTALLAELPRAVATLKGVAAMEARRRVEALNAGNDVRLAETNRMLAEMSVERLREASRERIRVRVLLDNGITDVLSVLENEDVLEALDGIGATSATHIRAAAHTMRQHTFEEMPMRIDINHRTEALTTFLQRLRDWDSARRHGASAATLDVAVELAPIAAAASQDLAHAIVVPTGTSTVEQFDESLRTVVAAASTIADVDVSGDPWDDLLVRPADYFALIAELGFITEDEEKVQGDLPTEIVEAIREFELKSEHLVASLRGYQSFGARFALVQRKVIIGDEMGLGKTVESIAALAHLRAIGEHHFIVICPAAVVTNWTRELNSKSRLIAYRIHGPERDGAAKQWVRSGGVAVTTFETLPWLTENISLPPLGCVVVDEAHYIKNPDARRSQRTARLLDASGRAILLTGTPLENRLDEFRNLVRYLRPDLLVDADEFAPAKFRRQVAPTYLRRNQEDVLTELPGLVEVDEWVAMSSVDVAEYRSAVHARNFMAMRKAAMKNGDSSAKMQRLIDIVAEAENNGRRVIVFSQFLDVLHGVCRHLPGRVFGPLTGSVAASKRQELVDDFSLAEGGAVLVAQIVAGGVGLNIQAASVVVICEPQLKPTTEWQAIARAHRMNQRTTVQVHRLLSDEGVDPRVREILARKKELFDSFARESDTAASAPEAYDITEAELARDIIDEERQRLFGGGSGRTSREKAGASEAQERMPQDDEAGRSPHVEVGQAVEPAISAPTAVPTTSAHTSVVPPRLTTSDLLAPYVAFTGALPAITTTSADAITANVVEIVSVEGPVTGWRIHQTYTERVRRSRSREELSRLVNRAISDAERRGLIVSDNPLGLSGNKPVTFRLPEQPWVRARELGPRTIDVVPVREVAEYCRLVSTGELSLFEDELVRRVAALTRSRQQSHVVRRVVQAVRRIAD